jgi:hypothetical protein
MSVPIGFKEWQVVCDALASGRQSILLRKGGIHEGRHGFSFAQPGDVIRITHHAEAVWAVTLTDWEQVAALESLHIYSEQTVRDRFNWEGKGMATGSIHLALVRVRELVMPWEFPYEARYGGCRSWLNLPAPPAGWKVGARPVLVDEDFTVLNQSLR